MEIVSSASPDCAPKAAAVLRAGGVILYPTDTLYGLGADALDDAAVANVRAIKGREAGKPIHAIVADLPMAAEYGEINELARALASAYLPGPLTLILKKKARIETGIARDMDTIGIRMPEDALCLALARELGRPYTATSANRAGEEPLRSVEAILAQLGAAAGHIDLAIDAGELPVRLPSTVVDVSSGTMDILREGALTREQLTS